MCIYMYIILYINITTTNVDFLNLPLNIYHDPIWSYNYSNTWLPMAENPDMERPEVTAIFSNGPRAVAQVAYAAFQEYLGCEKKRP